MVVTRRAVEVSVAAIYFPGVLQTEGVEAGGSSDPGTVGGGTSQWRDRRGQPRVLGPAVRSHQIIAQVMRRSHHGLPGAPAALAGVAPTAG